MAIKRIKNGVEVKITRAEMRNTIMRANDWTEDQYRKQYDLFKNKLRFYEELQRSRGLKVEVQSPQELLYKIARAKLRFGASYEQTQEVRAIMETSAVSISKGKKIAKTPSSVAYRRAVSRVVSRRFQGFIDHYPMAKEISLRLAHDPVAMERALTDYAALLHERDPRSGKHKDRGGAVFSGEETYGSSDDSVAGDFNIEDYITE